MLLYYKWWVLNISSWTINQDPPPPIQIPKDIQKHWPYFMEPPFLKHIVSEWFFKINSSVPLALVSDQQGDQERIEERLAHIADHLGFSWTGRLLQQQGDPFTS